MTDPIRAPPRRRHRDRRQPRAALRRRLARGRARRGDLRVGQRRGAPGRAQHARRPGAGRADRRRGRARPRGAARPPARDHARDPRPARHRLRRAAAHRRGRSATVTGSTSSSRRPARRPGEITLVTLGPLTNLAVALEREPALPRLLRGCTLMGGAFGSPGNTTPTTEWNIHCDPEAAKLVLRGLGDGASPRTRRSPRPLALGLDVTERARLLPERRRPARPARRQPAGRLASRSRAARTRCSPTRSVASNPIVRFVADALRFYFEFHARYDGFYGAFIHDPLAVAAALDRSLVTTEALFVDVETARRADDRDDRRGPAAPDRPATERRRRRRRPTSASSSTASSSGSGGAGGRRPLGRWHAA